MRQQPEHWKGDSMGVAEWFSDFCGTLRIGDGQRFLFAYRTSRITKALNA